MMLPLRAGGRNLPPVSYTLSIFAAAILRQLAFELSPHYRRLRAAHRVPFTVLEIAFFLLIVAPIIFVILVAAFDGLFSEQSRVAGEWLQQHRQR